MSGLLVLWCASKLRAILQQASHLMVSVFLCQRRVVKTYYVSNHVAEGFAGMLGASRLVSLFEIADAVRGH